MADKDIDSITTTARRVLSRARNGAAGDVPEASPTAPADGGGSTADGVSRDMGLQATSLTAQQVDDLLERPERILTVRSEDPDATMHRLEGHARHTGKAVYVWHPDQGLQSLKVNDMGVPGSARLSDALRYIANSRHYGVYAFVDFETQLNLSCIQLLHDIANMNTGNDRKIILVGREFRLPTKLAGLAAHLEHARERKLRMRDGRWVL